MQKEIKIILNGKEHSVPLKTTLEDLLESLKLDRSAIVIEMNEAVVDKQACGAIPLSPGDIIEILQFVGGG